MSTSAHASKKRVAVLRGGPSHEYEVSLRTGSAVLNALNESEHFEPLDIVITKTGEWLHEGRTRYPEHIVPAVDVIFIALHGAYGEDGRLQRTLDRFGTPYTGSGAYASGIAMNKAVTKDHLSGLSALLPQHMLLDKSELRTGRQRAGEVRARFGGEYILKPVSSGSSIGIVHIEDSLELADAIERMFAEHNSIMVEEYITGREFTCGVVERYRNNDLYALPPVEIIPPPESTFFDYEVKYNGASKEICPASISHIAKKAIEQAAQEVHTILNLRQYSRSDFIMNEKGLYFLEVNTLPGLTNESLFPKALAAVGSTFNDFIYHLVEDAHVACR